MFESKKFQIALLAMIVVILLIFAKMVNTVLRHWVILDAILDYKIECIMAEEQYFVDNDDRETLDETFWRLWDWSEKRILDKDDYKIIKPYIGRR